MEQSGAKNRHHFYHPKRLYRDDENIITLVLISVHKAYNSHFDHNCKWRNPHDRACHYEVCGFAEMCCYCKSLVPYGKRLF
jgi:hypothetical protein